MTEPVLDWTTDYDIFDPGYVRDPAPVWDELRGECPVAHTERWGGSWMPTRYEDVVAIAEEDRAETVPLGLDAHASLRNLRH